MSPLTISAEEAILSAKEPISTIQVCTAIGIKQPSFGAIIKTLREKYGDRLIEKKDRRRILYKIIDESELPKPLFALPEDLWRGWVNPDTKIVPAKLGF